MLSMSLFLNPPILYPKFIVFVNDIERILWKDERKIKEKYFLLNTINKKGWDNTFMKNPTFLFIVRLKCDEYNTYHLQVLLLLK